MVGAGLSGPFSFFWRAAEIMRFEESLVSAPLVEPVSLEEMKAFARISGAGDEALLQEMIGAARVWCENFTRRVFVRQVWDLTLFEPPAGRVIELPKAPLSEVLAMHFEYDGGQSDLWPSDHVVVHDDVVPGRIVLREAASWPFIFCGEGQLRVTYAAGYGEGGADVPETIRLAIKQIALHWYEQREPSLPGALIGRLPLMAEALLLPYRVPCLR